MIFDISFFISIGLFFIAFTVHEFAHGWVALKLGDPTAKYSGRLTLNPLKHIDPLGTIIVPILLYLSKSPFIFGWAKPVPVNFSRLNSPKRDIIWVGLAGPMANIIMALLIGLLFRSGLSIDYNLFSILQTLGILNLVLAVFNLIPIPPLDGSRVLTGLLPYNLARSYIQLEPFGMFILIALLALGLLRIIIWPIINSLAILIGLI
jgi:Zn-dependent protease